MNTIIFDLDGTLLPVKQEDYRDIFRKLFDSRMQSVGLDPKRISEGIDAGIRAVSVNDGSMTNQEQFEQVFFAYMGDDRKGPMSRKSLTKELDKFFKKDYDTIRFSAHPSSYVVRSVELLKKKGYTLAIAADQDSPAIAIEKRIQWTGLDLEDFDFIATPDTIGYCKPNISYYRYILRELDRQPEECLMVGNHVKEDLCAAKIGIDIFMITRYLINPNNLCLSDYKKGQWDAFYEYCNNLPLIRYNPLNTG